MTQFTIQDLTSFTQYLVSLRVINPAGLGPETKVVVMTDEGGKTEYLIKFYKDSTEALDRSIGKIFNVTKCTFKISLRLRLINE